MSIITLAIRRLRSFTFLVTLLMYMFLMLQKLNAFGQENLAPIVTAEKSMAKSPVDMVSYFNWPEIEDWVEVSNDETYISYRVQNLNFLKGSTLFICSLKDKQRIILPGVSEATFTNDSRAVLYRTGMDSICLLKLENGQKEFIGGVVSYQLVMHKGEEWLVSKLNNKEKTLLFWNLISKRKLSVKNVDDYWIGENGSIFFIQKTTLGAYDGSFSRELWSMDWTTLKEQKIWTGHDCYNMILDESGDRMAFVVQDSSGINKSIWLYTKGDEKAVEIFNPMMDGVPNIMQLESISNFNKDGSRLFIYLKERPVKQNDGIVALNIWSYHDAQLQPKQLREQNSNRSLSLSVISLYPARKLVQLIQPFELLRGMNEVFVLLTHCKGDPYEDYWNKQGISTSWLARIADGSRQQIPIGSPLFSPGGKYVTGIDTTKCSRDLFVYDIEKGITRNLTKDLKIPAGDVILDIPGEGRYRSLKFAGWLEGDKGLLIYDLYDIWWVDPEDRKPAIRLTNGRKQEWEYRLAGDYFDHGQTIADGTKILLKIFNKQTKKSGFGWLNIGSQSRTSVVYWGDYVFDFPRNNISRKMPLKLKEQGIYLIMRESTMEAPNLFSTEDFTTFEPLSDVHPEKAFNWMRSELVTFRTEDSIYTQAVLYKPEDFDAAKKYPLVIHYYDKKSDEKNEYKSKNPIGGHIDIAWFVSHGYMIAITDIHYKDGYTGESAKKTVEGLAKHLSKRDYINKDYIGIQGHSFGGFETNYIVTHSSMFAAAMSSAGVTNILSDFGVTWPSESSKIEYLENRTIRIGVLPWEDPEAYIRNTATYHVGNVTTPILLAHARKDKNVYFEQGLEFFTSLRRAGRKVWLLEYDRGGHGVLGKEHQDYIIRMQQFFDHYLRGMPAPVWMTRGIPASLKGVEDGLELDTLIRTPGKGLNY